MRKFIFTNGICLFLLRILTNFIAIFNSNLAFEMDGFIKTQEIDYRIILAETNVKKAEIELDLSIKKAKIKLEKASEVLKIWEEAKEEISIL